MAKRGYTYILATRKHGTLYIGVTSNLLRRVHQHKTGHHEGFTKRYSIHRLVYFEEFDDITDALYREKQLKKWNRSWKVELIESVNPNWRDLTQDLF